MSTIDNSILSLSSAPMGTFGYLNLNVFSVCFLRFECLRGNDNNENGNVNRKIGSFFTDTE